MCDRIGKNGGIFIRNIPDFTCEYGMATLILQEIPRCGAAYCIIQWAAPEADGQLLAECVRFCRMAGASRVLATGLPQPQPYPVYAQLIRMTAPLPSVPVTDAALWPLTEENGAQYVEIYNRGMAQVPAAVSLRMTDLPRLLRQGGCYFVHRGETLLGVGQVDGDQLLAVVSCIPGAGRDVAAALLSTMHGESAQLQVARSNHRALALYEKLGFTPVGLGERWWQIWEE